MQKVTTAMRPRRAAWAAAAANVAPRSMARKTDTGPEVNGIPATKPPTTGPHRRAVKVAIAMSDGVRISFAARIPIAPSNRSSRRSLTMEKDQVRCYWLRVQLTQHGGYLPAVIGAVVRQMLHHLPKRMGVRLAFRRTNVVHSRQILCCNP